MSTLNTEPGPDSHQSNAHSVRREEQHYRIILPPRLRIIEQQKADQDLMNECHVEPWYPNGPPQEQLEPPQVTAIMVHHLPSGLLLGVPAQETAVETVACAVRMLKAGLNHE